MSCETRFFPETKFGGFSQVDSTIGFYLRVNALLTPQSVSLDVGCGRGNYHNDPVQTRRNLRTLKGRVARAIGLDIDPSAAQNPAIDEFLLLESPASPWPLPDESVDLIVSDWTLEHVTEPDFFFREARRVLRTEGFLCLRTTNAWGYVALAARLLPERFHHRLLSWAQKTRQEKDIFPTVYRCNTFPAMRKMLARHHFFGVVFSPSGAPGYLNFSCLAYFLGLMLERLAPPPFRNTIFVFAQKQ
ncbi:MAG: class I SAM-dependent methyltransferase [Anaerolineales bacterium]